MDDGAPWFVAGSPGDGPPDEADGRVTDPERYLSLHALADDVVAELVARGATDAVPVEVDGGRWRGGVVRATELHPAGGGAAATVILTGFGVVVRTADGSERPFPSCGCDACDEDLAHLAAELAANLRHIAACDIQPGSSWLDVARSGSSPVRTPEGPR